MMVPKLDTEKIKKVILTRITVVAIAVASSNWPFTLSHFNSYLTRLKLVILHRADRMISSACLKPDLSWFMAALH